MPDPIAPPPGDAPTQRIVTVPRLIFFLIGCLLVGAAVWALVSNHDKLREAWDAAVHAPAMLIALCLLLPIANWVCTTGTLWTLTGRYGKVGFGEMLGLIGSAWLLNLLPLRLGMIGRIAYHKKFHDIKVRDCAIVLFQALGCSVVALGLLILWVLVVKTTLPGSAESDASTVHGELVSGTTFRTLALMCVPLPVLLLLFGAVRYWSAKPDSSVPHLWRWPAAVLFRYGDMLTWVVRYAIVFAIIGRPMTMMQSAIVTVSAQAAIMTPVQLGLREWVVGATAAFIGNKEGVPAGAGQGDRSAVDSKREGIGETGRADASASTLADPRPPLGERGYPDETLLSERGGTQAASTLADPRAPFGEGGYSDETPLSERGGTQTASTLADPRAPLGERGYPDRATPLSERGGTQAGEKRYPKAAGLLESATPGLMADVMMRAAELVIILPVGFASTWWLWRRMKRVKAENAES
ncbi:MAG: hypothetical protein H7210_02600 [Pyrinomonadaceae bacterium]|nr:hypothetical protein [Phycisphaerales bacterium]